MASRGSYERLKKSNGSKPKYKSPEEMREKIDNYFKECEGKALVDHTGDPILDRWGNPIIYGAKPPTVTGLALALGFKTRTSLIKYQNKKEFNDLILEAKSRVEEYCERQLFTRDGAKGAQFALMYNFGWKNPVDEEESGPAVKIINDIPVGATVIPVGATVNINTETAHFDPLHKPELPTGAPGESEKVSNAEGGEG